MRCEYCDVEVVNYPDNGICVCCGSKKSRLLCTHCHHKWKQR